LLTGILVFLQTQHLPAPSGTWNNVSGSWGDTANWAGGIICDGAGSTFATVALSPSGVTRTCTLDASRTIGQLNSINVNGGNRAFMLTDGGNTTLTLTLSMGGRPLFNVLNGPCFLNLALAGTEGVRFRLRDAGGLATVTVTRPQQYSGDTELAAYQGSSGISRVIVGVADALPHGSGKGNIVFTNFNNQGYGVLDLSTNNVTVNGLVSIGPGGRILATGDPGTSTLTVGDADASGDFGGVIEDNTRTVALTKIGTGTQVLGGNNSYTGPTTVEAGALIINGTLQNSPVTVNGGLLGGNGTLQNSVIVNAGGTISAGASVGILNLVGGLDLSAGGTNLWELVANSDTNPGTDFDQISLAAGRWT
jgi:autotransporter-associated beta strand protein